MVVVVLILLSLAVAGFIMATDARRNDSFRRLEQRGGDAGPIDGGGSCDSDGGGDGGGGD
jgi:hypothetical protein